ncbi:MAG: 3-keto-disaccharide hydrolase [Bryobacteraceae bacterium]
MNRRTFLATPAFLQSRTEESFTPLFDGKTLQGWTIVDGPETAFYVRDGAIVVHEGSGFPCWLRSGRQYENFDFRGEFFVKGWSDSGIYLHAPEHGRPMWCGMQIHIFQDRDEPPKPESMGAIFPTIPPLKVNVRKDWNTFRILMDWPRLRVWTNDEVVQDLDAGTVAELRHRLRQGYLGFESLSYPVHFRSLQIRELPSKESWQTLYETAADFGKWYISEGKPKFDPIAGVLRGEGKGHLATHERFRDFELQLYVRHSHHHNSGILFRSAGQGNAARHYEIQLHDVEGAHYPTGSLYSFKRAAYPRIQPEHWWPMQLIVKDRTCLVRINGDTILEYDKLNNLEEGSIELQAHQPGSWQEFKQIRIKRI